MVKAIPFPIRWLKDGWGGCAKNFGPHFLPSGSISEKGKGKKLCLHEAVQTFWRQTGLGKSEKKLGKGGGDSRINNLSPPPPPKPSSRFVAPCS